MRRPIRNRTLENPKWKQEANIKVNFGKVGFKDRSCMAGNINVN